MHTVPLPSSAHRVEIHHGFPKAASAIAFQSKTTRSQLSPAAALGIVLLSTMPLVGCNSSADSETSDETAAERVEFQRTETEQAVLDILDLEIRFDDLDPEGPGYYAPECTWDDIEPEDRELIYAYERYGRDEYIRLMCEYARTAPDAEIPAPEVDQNRIPKDSRSIRFQKD